jgi:hypothetical protein
LFDNPSLPTIRVRARENNVRKWTGRSVVPQGAAVPRGRCRGQTENGHSAHAEGGEPRSALKCAMPQCLARPRPAQNVCHGPLIALGRAAGTRVRPGGCQPRRGPDAPDVSQDSASFVLGADVTWCRAAAALGREGGRSRRRPSVSDCYLACGRARRRPSITADWTAARWKRRHRRDPCAARRPHRRKPPRCASRSTVQAGAVRCRPTPADRTLPRRA